MKHKAYSEKSSWYLCPGYTVFPKYVGVFPLFCVLLQNQQGFNEKPCVYFFHIFASISLEYITRSEIYGFKVNAIGKFPVNDPVLHCH